MLARVQGNYFWWIRYRYLGKPMLAQVTTMLATTIASDVFRLNKKPERVTRDRIGKRACATRSRLAFTIGVSSRSSRPCVAYVSEPFDAADCLFESKHDGFRAPAHIHRGAGRRAQPGCTTLP